MLTLLIGIIFGLVFLWVIFFAGRFASPAQAGEENEETDSEFYKYEQRQNSSLQVWDDDEADDEED